MREIPEVPSATELSTDPRWQLAQRVADSSNLRKCPKLRAFLLYVCENTLLGTAGNVREQLIGSKVFGRSADYNLNDDNIVRVEARELRKRLEAYFSGEGLEEPIVIVIPKGGYVPEFRPREQPAEETEIGSEDLAEAATVEGGDSKTPRPLPLALAATAVILAAVAIWLGIDDWRLRATYRSPAGTRAEDYSFYADLLGPLGASSRETLLVLSNPKVVLYFGSDSPDPVVKGSGHTVQAPPQLKGIFSDALNNLDRNSRYQFLQATREDYTGMGEAIAAFHLGRLLHLVSRPVRLTQGRFLTWERVPQENLILLGAPHINDWTHQNVGTSNFNIVSNGVENVKPRAGEPGKYLVRLEPGAKPGSALTDYGVVKRFASPYGFSLLLLAGCSSPGTGGAGEFFANPAKMKAVHDRIRAAAPGKPFPSTWEVVIKIDVRDGLPVETTAVAFRP